MSPLWANFLYAGATLVVIRIDRPGHLLEDLQDIVHERRPAVSR